MLLWTKAKTVFFRGMTWVVRTAAQIVMWIVDERWGRGNFVMQEFMF